MTTPEQLTNVDPNHQKGYESEAMAVEGLKTMVRFGRNIKELKVPPVVEVIQPEQYSRLDHHGVDIVAVTADGYQIPVSVNSSLRSQRRYRRRHKMRRAKGWFTVLAESVLILATDTQNVVIKKLADYVNRMYNIIRRESNKVRHRLRLQAERRHGRVPDRGTFVRQLCFNN